uniref:Uncharacterized protein n=1 Tax=Tanacetum cinerariifolium TaxID=118510 RepID=A0A699I891_TANCI|nr:hypothetical protein [Tanacetum cinerariifolium]
MDGLIDFSGESFVQDYMKFFKAQQLAETRCFVNRIREKAQTVRNVIAQSNALIAEMEALEDQGEVFDTLMCLRDDRRVEETKLMGLNDLITHAKEEIEITRSIVGEYGASFEHVAYFLCMSEICFRWSHGSFFILDKLTEVAESSRLPDKMKVVFDQACSEEKAFASLMKDLSLSLMISVSKKHRLVAKLEALVEHGDPARPLEHMRVMLLVILGCLGN